MRRTPARHRKWLLQELPALEEEGVLTAEERLRLESYYTTQGEHRSPWAMIAFGVLGALLIGGGTLLLFAHNWDQLARPTRAILAFCPLAIGVGLSLLALRRGGVGWRESAGIFHAVAVGTCIALIGQTYHLTSNAPAFLVTWALLVMPLIFLLRSTGAFLIYVALICAWCEAAQSVHGHAAGFWLLVLPALARVGQLIREDRRALPTVVSLWGMMLMLPIALGLVLEKTVPGLWTLAFASLASLAGLLGIKLYPQDRGWRNPMATLALLGITLLAYIFTWQDVWWKIGWHHSRVRWDAQTSGLCFDAAITLVLATCWAALAVAGFRRRFGPEFILSTFPLVAGLGFFLALMFTEGALMSALLFNVFVFALGLAQVVQGCRATQLRQVNQGMAVLGLLLLTRFFDSGFGFLARGLAFIVIGSGFLTINLMIARKKRSQDGGPA